MQRLFYWSLFGRVAGNAAASNAYDDRTATPYHNFTGGAWGGNSSGGVDRSGGGATWCRPYAPSCYFLPAAYHPPSIIKTIQMSREKGGATGGGYTPPLHPHDRPALTSLLLSAAQGQFEDAY